MHQRTAASPAGAGFRLPGDPISEASGALRRAALVPFEATHARDWAHQFGRCLSAARRALSWHGDHDDDEVPGLFPDMDDEAPRTAVSFHEADHAELLQRCADLVDRVGSLDVPDLWDMVELAEAAKLLERDIAAFRARAVGGAVQVRAKAKQGVK
ncbi:MAG: hypothetical protein IT303_05025 [Dehalococcoidia bacterium]|nr:hypothetical protein [Dehalococcoidia bacterium]